MNEIDYEATARAAGWEIGHQSPHGEVLVHEYQDRIWESGDWKGALTDLGFHPDDPDRVNDIVYMAEPIPSV